MSGPAVVFTGKLSLQTRKEASAEAVQHGYVVRAQVSKNSNFLVCGSNVGAKKMEEARWLGVTVLTEEQWKTKLNERTGGGEGTIKAERAAVSSFGLPPGVAQPSPAQAAQQFGSQSHQTSNSGGVGIKAEYAFTGSLASPWTNAQVYPTPAARLLPFQSLQECIPFMNPGSGQASSGCERVAGYVAAGPFGLPALPTQQCYQVPQQSPLGMSFEQAYSTSCLANPHSTHARGAARIVVFEGRLKHQTWEMARAVAEQHGYVVQTQLTNAVRYLVCGNGVTRDKVQEAFSLGVATVSEEMWRRELDLGADAWGYTIQAEHPPARPAVKAEVTAWSQPNNKNGQPTDVMPAGAWPAQDRVRVAAVASRPVERTSSTGNSVMSISPSSIGVKRSHVEHDEGGDDEVVTSMAPKVALKDGVFYEVKGSTGSTYRVKRLGSVYSCSCPAWKFQHDDPATRTCKHLRQLLGDEFETMRAGESSARSRRAGKRARRPSKKSSIKGDVDLDQMTTTESAVIVKESAPNVLLAMKWDRKKNDPVGWWISEKLDGVRAFWDSRRRIFLSRLGNEYPAPSWFTKDFPSDMDLDGELFGGRGAFQFTVGIVKSRGSKSWEKLVYKVFDAPSLEQKTFEDRMKFAQAAVTKVSSTYIEWVEHTVCKSLNHLDEVFDQVETLGGEGLMIREPGSRYVGGRSSSLLKIKTFHDGEAVLLAYEPGKGKYMNMVGALRCRMASGKIFKVASGLSDKDRAAPPALGSVVVYKCQELTKDGMPRFPIFLGVAADKACAKDPVVPNATAYE